MRAGAPWCTLCLTPTASREPEPMTPPAPQPPPAGPVELVAVPVDAQAPVPGGWPCTACGHPNALDVSACAVCGSGFLARLSAEDAPALKLPVVGDMRRFQRGQPFVLLGLVVTGVLVVLVLAALAGMLLG